MVKKYKKPTWGVMEGDILRAAQTTQRAAKVYMAPGRRLVRINITKNKKR